MLNVPKIETHTNFIKIKPRSETNHIVVHCSATRCSDKYDWKTIDQMHRQKGWLMIGYHYVIKKDGTIQQGRDEESIGAHVEGHNEDTIGICLIGGVDIKGKSTNNFTQEQFDSLRLLVDYLLVKYKGADVLGHRDFPNVNKDCPCFDVKKWYTNGVKYIKLEDINDIDKILNTWKISKGVFEELNEKPVSELKEGDLVRVR